MAGICDQQAARCSSILPQHPEGKPGVGETGLMSIECADGSAGFRTARRQGLVAAVMPGSQKGKTNGEANGGGNGEAQDTDCGR